MGFNSVFKGLIIIIYGTRDLMSGPMAAHLMGLRVRILCVFMVVCLLSVLCVVS